MVGRVRDSPDGGGAAAFGAEQVAAWNRRQQAVLTRHSQRLSEQPAVVENMLDRYAQMRNSYSGEFSRQIHAQRLELNVREEQPTALAVALDQKEKAAVALGKRLLDMLVRDAAASPPVPSL